MCVTAQQIQALSSDTETRVLNDLDEKIHRMAEIVMADAPMQKLVTGIEEHDYEKSYGASAKEVALPYYILSICNHAYAMRLRKVLDDNEWSGWLQWIGNLFRRNAKMSQIWKLLEDVGFDPDFQKFINSEIRVAKPR